MENSSNNTALSFLEPVGFLLLLNFLIIPLHKLLSNSISSYSSNHKDKQHHQKRRCSTPEEQAFKIEEVEAIMSKMNIRLSTEDEQTKNETTGVHEISTLFEENEPSLEEAKEAFHVFDENRDGFIDAGELQRVLSKTGFIEEGSMEVREFQEMIKACDRNNDGKIDFLEFVEFLEGSFC